MNYKQTFIAIIIFFKLTKQDYDCLNWKDLSKKVNLIFNNIKWEDIAIIVQIFHSEYYQLEIPFRPQQYKQLIKDTTLLIYYPQVDYILAKKIKNQIRFARDFQDDENIHVTKLAECGYDTKKGLIILTDKPYDRKYEINDYTNKLKQYYQQGNDIQIVYYNIMRTIDLLSDYEIAQMHMDQQFLFLNDGIPYFYIDIFVNCKSLPINETYEDPIANQIVQNSAISKDVMNYIFMVYILQFHLFVIDEPLEINKFFSFNYQMAQNSLKVRQIVRIFMNRYIIYYVPGQPNKTKTFFSQKIGQRLDPDFSFIYNFQQLFDHLYYTPRQDRRNLKYLMASFNNCFKYSTQPDPEEQIIIKKESDRKSKNQRDFFLKI